MDGYTMPITADYEVLLSTKSSDLGQLEVFASTAMIDSSEEWAITYSRERCYC